MRSVREFQSDGTAPRLAYRGGKLFPLPYEMGEVMLAPSHKKWRERRLQGLDGAG